MFTTRNERERLTREIKDAENVLRGLLDEQLAYEGKQWDKIEAMAKKRLEDLKVSLVRDDPATTSMERVRMQQGEARAWEQILSLRSGLPDRIRRTETKIEELRQRLERFA